MGSPSSPSLPLTLLFLFFTILPYNLSNQSSTLAHPPLRTPATSTSNQHISPIHDDPLFNIKPINDNTSNATLTDPIEDDPAAFIDQHHLEAYISPFEKTIVEIRSHKPEHPGWYVIFGFIIMILAIPFVWLSERRIAERTQIKLEGEKTCQEIESSEYNPDLNRELVCVKGTISNSTPISDPSFGVTLPNAIKMKRVVEVFQVREVQPPRKLASFRDSLLRGGKTPYMYENIWCSFSIPSQRFHDAGLQAVNNNVRFIEHTQTFTARTVDFGQHKLAPFQIERLNNWEPEPLGSKATEIEEATSAKVRKQLEGYGWKECYITVEDNYILIKQFPGNDPKTGDMKVSFYKVQCTDVTVVAEQAGISFRPYNVRQRAFLPRDRVMMMFDDPLEICPMVGGKVDMCCQAVCCWSKLLDRLLGISKIIDWIYTSKISKEDVFRQEVKDKRLVIIVLRVLGLTALVLGIWFMMRPWVWDLLITRKLSHIISFGEILLVNALGTAFYLLISGFAWMFYRQKKKWAITALLVGTFIFGVIFIYENWDSLLI